MRNQYRIEDDRVYIELRRKTGDNLHAIASVSDLPKLQSLDCRWSACKEPSTGGFYVKTMVGGKLVLMHRFLLDAVEGTVVDHKNHDTLDNTRDNIELTTIQGNNLNQRTRKTNKSGIRGVSWYQNIVSG